MSKGHAYNWQATRFGGDDHIWHLALPALLAGMPHKVYDEIDTENVTIQVFANGVEVNAKHFIEGLENQWSASVARRVSELLDEVHLGDLEDAFAAAQEAARGELVKRFAAMGIELSEENR